jgi:hypothetical protein
MGFTDIFKIGSTIIDKIASGQEQKRDMKLKLLEMQQNKEVLPLMKQYEAIVQEAKSKDPWTSRARPSFMYVIYIMILAGIPMGICFAVSPETASNVATGLKMWLNAIPGELYALFGAGYLGYGGLRTFDKVKRLSVFKED